MSKPADHVLTEEQKERLRIEDEIDKHLPDGYCSWCYQKITSNIHMCDCMECSAPAFYCKHPRPKWWVLH